MEPPGGRRRPDRDARRVAGPASTASGRSAARRAQGVRVCILDSGVEADHPLVGERRRARSSSTGEDDETGRRRGRREGDVCGHGTACAGIVRSLAPDVRAVQRPRARRRLHRQRRGRCSRGLRWAVEQGFDVINMSLSTTKKQFAAVLHELADSAYFRRTVLVASAHNMPVESYPWRFSSVISVGQPRGRRPADLLLRTPSRRSSSSPAASTSRSPGSAARRSARTGNSFATPHIAGICALVLAQAPGADAVPAEERALPDGRRTSEAADDDEPICARRSPPACSARRSATARSCSRSSRSRARSSARRRRRSSCSTRRRTSSSSRPSPARARRRCIGSASRPAPGIAGWVLVTRQPLVIDDVAERSALRARRRRGDRLRAEGADGGAAARTRSARSACSRCSTGRSARASRSQEMELLGPVREPGGDRARPAPARPARASGARRRGRASPVARVAERGSRRSRTSERSAGLALLASLADVSAASRSARRVPSPDPPLQVRRAPPLQVRRAGKPGSSETRVPGA